MIRGSKDEDPAYFGGTEIGVRQRSNSHVHAEKSTLRPCRYNHRAVHENVIMMRGTSLHSKGRADHAAGERYSGSGVVAEGQVTSIAYLGQDRSSLLGSRCRLRYTYWGFIPC
jgi:hypothetical protein